MTYLILLTAACLAVCFFLVKNDQSRIRVKKQARQNWRVEEAAGSRAHPKDKRDQKRKMGPFIAVAVYDPVTQETIQASIYDASRNGAGLVAEEWLPRGRELTLLVADHRVQMLVRNCSRKNSRWVAGCEFSEPLPDAVTASLGLPLN